MSFLLATIGLINSSYSNSLTRNSLRYARLNEENDNYYYQSIELNVNQSGLYQIINDSPIFLYGYLYNNSFDPNNPSINLITFDHDTPSNPNFSFSSDLNANNRYILVITTVNPSRTGSFFLTISGAGETTFTTPIITTTTLEG